MALQRVTGYEAENLIKSESKFAILFGADWCAPCKVVEPMLEKASVTSNIKVVKIDVDEEYEFAQKFKMKSVPMIAMFKDGQLVATEGMGPQEKLLSALKD